MVNRSECCYNFQAFHRWFLSFLVTSLFSSSPIVYLPICPFGCLFYVCWLFFCFFLNFFCPSLCLHFYFFMYHCFMDSLSWLKYNLGSLGNMLSLLGLHSSNIVFNLLWRSINILLLCTFLLSLLNIWRKERERKRRTLEENREVDCVIQF